MARPRKKGYKWLPSNLVCDKKNKQCHYRRLDAN